METTRIATIATIAKVCHQANKAFCEANGDFSQRDWDEAEAWQRESAIKGVDYRLKNPEGPPSAQHDAWMKDKIENGWIYGPEKNTVTKEHPCIVPYEQLPEFQRKKDHLFQGIVDALK